MRYPAGVSRGTGPSAVRVLVAEDDEPTRAALAAVLADEGYGVAQAADGDEALAVLAGAGGSVGLVLLDLMMPNASGWKVLEGLPAGPARPAVVVVSALDPALVRLPRTIGRFVRKPFAVEDLVEAVREHAGGPRG